MAGFTSWQGLATYPGATAATLLVTRVLHQVWHNRLVDVPEVAVAYIVALVLLVLATLAIDGNAPKVLDFVLCIINAVGVSVTVVGGNTLFGLTSPAPRQEVIRAPPVERVQPPNGAPPS
jgi:cytochrome bd-type quinol oxidase subunit 2